MDICRSRSDLPNWLPFLRESLFPKTESYPNGFVEQGWGLYRDLRRGGGTFLGMVVFSTAKGTPYGGMPSPSVRVREWE